MKIINEDALNTFLIITKSRLINLSKEYDQRSFLLQLNDLIEYIDMFKYHSKSNYELFSYTDTLQKSIFSTAMKNQLELTKIANGIENFFEKFRK